jgi:WD domain, G-beta repeat
MSVLRRIGEVAREDGSLAMIVADARDAAAWGAYQNGDFDRACEAIHAANGPGALGLPIAWSQGKGIFTDLGGAGSADVFRLGPDELLLSPLYAASDWTKATEKAYYQDVGALPAKATTNLGDVAIRSGVVALVWAGKRATGITDERLATAGEKGAAKRPWGLLAALPNGSYDVLYEATEVNAPWGIMECRLRVVPRGRAPAVALPGSSATKPKVKTKRPVPAPRHVLELTEGANRVATLAFSPDGKTLGAGGNGVSAAALFRVPDFARVALFEDIGPTGFDFSTQRYSLTVQVCFGRSGESVAISVGERVEIRRCAGGEVTHRGIHVRTPGGERKMFSQTLPPIPLEQRREAVAALELEPDLSSPPCIFVNGARFLLEDFRADRAEIAELVESKAAHRIRPNVYLRSPTGTRLLVNGPMRIIDVARAFDEEPLGLAFTKTSSSHFAWSHDERFIALIEDFRPKTIIHDGKTGEKIAVLKTPSPRIEQRSLAFQPRGSLLALGESDGTVRLFDTGSWKPVMELPNHDTTTLDTESRTIGALAWSPDGRWLAVGNGLRNAPGAICIYAAEDLASIDPSVERNDGHRVAARERHTEHAVHALDDRCIRRLVDADQRLAIER